MSYLLRAAEAPVGTLALPLGLLAVQHSPQLLPGQGNG